MDKSLGLAGSAAVINVDGTVEAVLTRATQIEAAARTVEAHRGNKLVSVAAGGSGSFIGNATEVAGSVAVVKRDDTIKALVSGATAALGDDSSVTAADTTHADVVAGSVAVTAHSGVYVQQASGNLTFHAGDAVSTATGLVSLTAPDSILDGTNGGQTNITGPAMTLSALAGSVGAADDLVRISLGAGLLTVRYPGDPRSPHARCEDR